MRLISFRSVPDDGPVDHLGALIDGDADAGEIVDLTRASRELLRTEGLGSEAAARVAQALVPPHLLGLIESGPRGRELADAALAAVLAVGADRGRDGDRLRYRSEDVTVLPAITAPPMLRDFMAFEKHLLNVFPRLGREIPDEWYQRPVYYKANTASIGAHGDDITIPAYEEDLDLEFEFAAILGRPGTDISEDQARAHIFGYTVYDDFSARRIQAKEMTVGLGPAKGKDFTRGHVLGPVVVTADELADPYSLRMTGTVNGERWTEGTSADMHWRFEQMIAYASKDEPLRAGEVFGSGTVGDGSGAEQGRSLTAGDLVELTVERIGTLRNRIVGRADTTKGNR